MYARKERKNFKVIGKKGTETEPDVGVGNVVGSCTKPVSVCVI